MQQIRCLEISVEDFPEILFGSSGIHVSN